MLCTCCEPGHGDEKYPAPALQLLVVQAVCTAKPTDQSSLPGSAADPSLGPLTGFYPAPHAMQGLQSQSGTWYWSPWMSVDPHALPLSCCPHFLHHNSPLGEGQGG